MSGLPVLTSPGRRPLVVGSYDPAEVTFLLQDLSHVALEQPTETREAARRAGAHYAETLPQEYRPSPAYLDLFEAALATSARRVAVAVGVVAELVREERGPEPVLVSLARAGTPVGVLLRRWLAWRHGDDAPHYSVSIVRDRGVDEVALGLVVARHDPARVQFVDGWTGKGAIARELADALARWADGAGPRLDPGLAVLADPGSCTTVFGTRDDFLLPSACLSSTVSGLVSRTVLAPALVAAGELHGAKVYRELAGEDLSRRHVDTIAACFPAVRAEVDSTWPSLRDSDRTPGWTGWAAVQRVAAEHGVSDLNLVKPGVGETTRVLLRRVPDRVLVEPAALGDPDLAHVLMLAADRGVPVEERRGLGFRCMGLIR